MKQEIFNNIKNIFGWKTSRKIVVISVDDYGNVRLDSKQARERMNTAGLKVLSRFDAYDTLETREDLEMLFDVLLSVKDKNGQHAVFTPFAVPCNIDFEKVINGKYSSYHYELLPVTYQKLAARDPKTYEGAWMLWQEGLGKGIVVPQFHGREHISLKIFEEKLNQNDFEVITCLNNRSYTSITHSGYSTIGYTAAFDFWKIEENQKFAEIIFKGLDAFEEVFGYRSTHFTPPGGREHHVIHQYLNKSGIQYVDTPFIKLEHQGEGKYLKSVNYTGKRNKSGVTCIVRNVVFEPTDDRGFSWVDFSLKQVAAAFRWHRPAIISSHRVNYCGHISQDNRKLGLNALRLLLKKIVSIWPDVEFMSSRDLIDVIGAS